MNVSKFIEVQECGRDETLIYFSQKTWHDGLRDKGADGMVHKWTLMRSIETFGSVKAGNSFTE
jgi:hypothetical protein